MSQRSLARTTGDHTQLFTNHYRQPAWRRLAIVSLLATTSLMGACRPTSQSATGAAPATVSPDTWAVVDGKEIKKTEVETAVRQGSDPAQVMSHEEALNARLSVLDDLITQEVLLAKARQQNLTVPEADIDKAFTEVKQGATEEAFQQQLTSRGLTAADVREGLKRRLLSQKVIDTDVTAKVTVTDQEVTDFFNANRQQFNLPEDSFRLAQIVVTPVRDAQVPNRTGDDAATPQAATAKIAMLMDRLTKGTPFAELARDYSEDPESTPRGGDLGLVPMSAVKQAPAPLRDAVLQLAPGKARVVNQGGAITIVYVVSKEQAGQRDLSTPGVRQQITNSLRANREQLMRGAYLTAARTDARVVNYLARTVVESQGAQPATSK